MGQGAALVAEAFMPAGGSGWYHGVMALMTAFVARQSVRPVADD